MAESYVPPEDEAYEEEEEVNEAVRRVISGG